MLQEHLEYANNTEDQKRLRLFSDNTANFEEN